MRRDLHDDPGSGSLSLPGAMTGRSLLGVMDETVKRGLDILAAGALLVLLALPIALIVVLIRIDSPGPGFYRCRRIGFRGREFKMLKFRKMHDDAEGPALTTKGDERFTRFGPVPRELEARRGASALERRQGPDEPGRPSPGGPELRRGMGRRVRHDPRGAPRRHGPLPDRVREGGRDPRPRGFRRPLPDEHPPAEGPHGSALRSTPLVADGRPHPRLDGGRGPACGATLPSTARPEGSTCAGATTRAARRSASWSLPSFANGWKARSDGQSNCGERQRLQAGP